MIVKRPEFITEEKLREMAREARGQIKNIYLHWTKGRYGQPDDRTIFLWTGWARCMYIAKFWQQRRTIPGSGTKGDFP